MKIVGCLVLVLALASTTSAKTLPSQVDLRAAYCIIIVQDALREIAEIRDIMRSAPLPPTHQAVGEQKLAATATQNETNLQRLQRYLLPRLPYLALAGIETAMASGVEDTARMHAQNKACLTRCRTEGPPRPAAELACTEQCNEKENPALARTRICDDLRWLPF
jgi:hypothetical protein